MVQLLEMIFNVATNSWRPLHVASCVFKFHQPKSLLVLLGIYECAATPRPGVWQFATIIVTKPEFLRRTSKGVKLQRDARASRESAFGRDTWRLSGATILFHL